MWTQTARTAINRGDKLREGPLNPVKTGVADRVEERPDGGYSCPKFKVSINECAAGGSGGLTCAPDRSLDGFGRPKERFTGTAVAGGYVEKYMYQGV
ncbi:hypothetical protein Zmor_009250 [Zophobas morio]|uniref:Uncharacterized protein n=1 Tax=Zophobas morio TaxID=2755281 RepID=A0AA38INY7_9CUCU|nr:hypothetical protein Zmor_009250 [Zophobas morio]